MNFEQRILWEDNHLLIVNKLPGELVQGDKTGDSTLLDKAKNYIKKKYDKPGAVFMGLPHRLDRPTSGLVVLCRTSKALSRMTEIFKNRTVSKVYWALVSNKPQELQSHLVDYLIRNQKQNKSYVHQGEDKSAKRAELKYCFKKSSDRYHLLEIELLTGRHHQIRVQLANMGSPIKGDLKYGAKRSNPDGSISLHARSMEFIHPVKKEPLKIIAEPPRISLWNYFAANA